MFLFISRFVFLITIVVFKVSSFQNKYCELGCNNFQNTITHTVCDRNEEKCGPGPKCGPDFHIVSFDDDDRQYILDIHNYLRNKVALGYEKRGGIQPKAANMNIMKYNRELEFIAQCWANTCNGNPLEHDFCRSTEIFSHVGQNLGFINSSLPEINKVRTIKELILLWYDEVAIFNNSWVIDTQDRGPDFKVGHYTQLIWADTTDIGCAASYYTTNSSNRMWYHMIFVCNYGPGGNYLGAPIYARGKPGSRCPNGLKRNSFFFGLCGKSKSVYKTEVNEEFDIFNII